MTQKKIVPEAGQNQASINTNTMTQQQAIRFDIQERYDLLDPNFLRFMAMIGGYGAQKYGDRNWQLSRLEGNRSPINHIFKHLVAYQNDEAFDHHEVGSKEYFIHLASIAFNAMMQFYHDYKEYMTIQGDE